MARKKGGRTSRPEDLEQIDIYYIPKEQASMYRVLRDVIKDEVLAWAEERFSRVDTIQDPDEGEGIAGYDSDDNCVFQYFLNPMNISKAQKARDKEHLDLHLEEIQAKMAQK